MKKLTILALLAALVALAGCGSGMEDKAEAWCRQYADGLISGDIDKAYRVVQDLTTMEEFEPVFERYHELMVEIDSYELETLRTNIERDDDTATLTAVYMLHSDVGIYIIEITDVDDTELPDALVFGTLDELEHMLEPYEGE